MGPGETVPPRPAPAGASTQCTAADRRTCATTPMERAAARRGSDTRRRQARPVYDGDPSRRSVARAPAGSGRLMVAICHKAGPISAPALPPPPPPRSSARPGAFINIRSGQRAQSEAQRDAPRGVSGAFAAAPRASFSLSADCARIVSAAPLPSRRPNSSSSAPPPRRRHRRGIPAGRTCSLCDRT